MPQAIPVIASFAVAGEAVAAAGGIAAAMGTATGFLSVAGAALTGIGALTGKNDLMKIGGFMSLAGGVGGMLGGAAAEGGTIGSILEEGAQGAGQLGAAAGGEYGGGAGMIGDYAGKNAMPTAVKPTDATSIFDKRPGILSTDPRTGSESNWLGKLGKTVKDNKELFFIGGQMLSSALGPEAQMLDMKRQEMEDRRRNLNSPVSVGMLRGPGG